MSDIRSMPYVTVEQVHRFREAALSEIAALRSQLEAIQWRPIESSKPTDYGCYLVWHKGYQQEILYYQLHDGGTDGLKAGNWYGEDEPYPRNYQVSHWMPLPPAPDKPEV